MTIEEAVAEWNRLTVASRALQARMDELGAFIQSAGVALSPMTITFDIEETSDDDERIFVSSKHKAD